MLNAPKQSLKPSGFGCELRGNLENSSSYTTSFAFGWGGTADADSFPSDSFEKYSEFLSTNYTIPSNIKTIRVYGIGDGKKSNCPRADEVDPNFCELARCPEISACCDELGACCYNVGELNCGCTGPITETDCLNQYGSSSFHPGISCDAVVLNCCADPGHCCVETDTGCGSCFQCYEAGSPECQGKSSEIGECGTSDTCDTSGCNLVSCCNQTTGECRGCVDSCNAGESEIGSCDDCEASNTGVTCCKIFPDGSTDCGFRDNISSCTELGDDYSSVADCVECDSLIKWRCLLVGPPGQAGRCIAGLDGLFTDPDDCEGICQSACGGNCTCDFGKGECVPCDEGTEGCGCCSQCNTFCKIQQGFAGPVLTSQSELVNARLNATSYNTPTTLDFSAGSDCRICDIRGEEFVGGQTLDCPSTNPSGFVMEYDLSNLCINDSVRLNILKKHNGEVVISVYVDPTGNDPEILVFKDVFKNSIQIDPELDDYDCGTCEFDYNCPLTSEQEIRFRFIPPLSIFSHLGSNVKSSHREVSLLTTSGPYTRSISSNIVAITEEPKWTDIYDNTGIIFKVPYLNRTNGGANTVHRLFANWNPVAITRINANGINGDYVQNSSFVDAYGITCSCDEAGGCESGDVYNPAFIGIAGQQG